MLPEFVRNAKFQEGIPIVEKRRVHVLCLKMDSIRDNIVAMSGDKTLVRLPFDESVNQQP